MNMITRKRKTPRCEDEGEEEEEMDDLEKRGKVLLWDLLVNDNDDVCFKHILPRLNRTDVKFLHEVNKETRKLIKRSSRASDLKKRFKIEEMSSISTLEVAWEHNRRGEDVCTTKQLSAGKLLTRINSSCSSGYERRKSVSGMDRRLKRPQKKVIWIW